MKENNDANEGKVTAWETCAYPQLIKAGISCIVSNPTFVRPNYGPSKPIVLRLIAAHEYDALLHPEFLAFGEGKRGWAISMHRKTSRPRKAGPKHRPKMASQDLNVYLTQAQAAVRAMNRVWK